MACWNVIDHTEFSGSANGYEKTSIPASYDHLYFVASARSDASTYYDFCHFQLNGDTTDSNYHSIFQQTVSSTPACNAGAYTWGAQIPVPSTLADTFSTVKIWIPNYADTSNFKQALAQSTAPNNSTTDSQWNVAMAANLWKNTAAINAFKFLVYGGSDNMVQYSTFTLYGINGAG